MKRHGHELTDAEGMGVNKVVEGNERDMSFLNEVMEVRMEIEAADPKVLEDIQIVEKIDQQNQGVLSAVIKIEHDRLVFKEKIQDTVKMLDRLLSPSKESEPLKSPNWNIVRRTAVHLRYLESIQKAVKDWMERVEMVL